METRIFAVIVLSLTGQRTFEVNAPDEARARAAVEMVLNGQGLCGPFEMVVTGSHVLPLRDHPRWKRRAS